MDQTTSCKPGSSHTKDLFDDVDRGRSLNIAQTVHTETNVENITSWTTTVPLECTQESPVVTDVKAAVNVTCVKSSLHNQEASIYRTPYMIK